MSRDARVGTLQIGFRPARSARMGSCSPVPPSPRSRQHWRATPATEHSIERFIEQSIKCSIEPAVWTAPRPAARTLAYRVPTSAFVGSVSHDQLQEPRGLQLQMAWAQAHRLPRSAPARLSPIHVQTAMPAEPSCLAHLVHAIVRSCDRVCLLSTIWLERLMLANLLPASAPASLSSPLSPLP